MALGLLRLVDNPKKLRRMGQPVFRLTGFRKRAGESRTPTRIAVIKLDRLGDLVLGSAVLAGLRRAWPKARITLMVRESLVEVARLCPDVDEVIGAPVNEGSMMFDPQLGTYRGWRQQLAHWLIFCHRRRLWARRFDAVIVPRWDTDFYGAVPLAYVTGAPRRFGASEAVTPGKAMANRGFDQLLSQVIAGESRRHEILLNESFLQAAGIQPSGQPELVSWAKESDREQAVGLMQNEGMVASKVTVALCLGANSAGRRMWPVDSYARLCRTVFNLDSVQLVTFGTAGEKGLGVQLKNLLGNGVLNLEGKCPLNLLPAAISLAAFYLGSDTGTMHVAAAAGLPVFEISCHPASGDAFGGESPRRFGPWAVRNRIMQPEKAAAPCEQFCASEQPHCILGVSVEASAEALRSLLKEIGLRKVCREQPCQSECGVPS